MQMRFFDYFPDLTTEFYLILMLRKLEMQLISTVYGVNISKLSSFNGIRSVLLRVIVKSKQRKGSTTIKGELNY
jgi:hypothetical protein